MLYTFFTPFARSQRSPSTDSSPMLLLTLATPQAFYSLPSNPIMAQRHFLDWDEIKHEEEKVIRAPHFGFRAISAVLFLMAFYLALARISISSSFAPVYFLISSLAASALLVLLFTRGFSFSKWVFFLSLLAFEFILVPAGMLLSFSPFSLLLALLNLLLIIYLAWLRR